MKLNYYQNPSQFFGKTKDYLLSEEACHCLILGIIDRLISNVQAYDSQFHLASVEVGENVVAVAVMTEPYKLVLSCQDLGAIEVLAQYLHAEQIQPPGVNAQTEQSLMFAQTWQKLTGQKYQQSMQMRVHQLQAVQPIVRAKGNMRNATEDDRNILLQWSQEFAIEVFGKEMPNSQRFINNQLEQKTIYIWQDEIPVSFVCCAGSTPNGKRLGPVYTPPEHRKKGYATTCVADLSQKFLSMGSQFCFLFTDLANPVSNHIYRKIGYLPVADFCEFNFV